MSRFTGMLAMAGPELADTQPVRREVVRRIIALEPIIDQSLGDSSRLRYLSPVLQRAVDGCSPPAGAIDSSERFQPNGGF
jgi:hypothetical protein